MTSHRCVQNLFDLCSSAEPRIVNCVNLCAQTIIARMLHHFRAQLRHPVGPISIFIFRRLIVIVGATHRRYEAAIRRIGRIWMPTSVIVKWRRTETGASHKLAPVCQRVADAREPTNCLTSVDSKTLSR